MSVPGSMTTLHSVFDRSWTHGNLGVIVMGFDLNPTANSGLNRPYINLAMVSCSSPLINHNSNVIEYIPKFLPAYSPDLEMR